ncbi:DNA-binding MarR family transcriptional regulator [Endobacter medicaginis]|jgi:DNA-binding MarR family transcriptional regulator|uniref:MarR family transcriptional regulator n=1 Tax=Endobacter medicaginis TaxID=1181271 RepID=A0A839V2S6_9PROT|nr:MarR family transcriptional regulator [Endobacter medicaginis]MBB3173801.1 DNA-binding MarR family transcriptional regulator [Endobacter medicaginis]MCX5475562.1 MarR family transcriptional regulator [Endobacter medicaginis]NVN29139.1 MarR family transcriptional regulator [Endobacter medicaginis]
MPAPRASAAARTDPEPTPTPTQSSDLLASPDMLQVADRLRPLILRLGRHLRREAQLLGVSALDASFLVTINQRPGTGVSELADLEQMSRPAMSAHVKRLVKAGLVKVQDTVPGADKRRIGLAISPTGLQMIQEVSQRRNDWLAANLGRLSPRQVRDIEAAIEPLTQILLLNAN